MSFGPRYDADVNRVSRNVPVYCEAVVSYFVGVWSLNFVFTLHGRVDGSPAVSFYSGLSPFVVWYIR